MSFLNAELPLDCAVIVGTVRFFDKFYKISDTPEAHEDYCRMFAPDATFILASKTSTGRDGELAIFILL